MQIIFTKISYKETAVYFDGGKTKTLLVLNDTELPTICQKVRGMARDVFGMELSDGAPLKATAFDKAWEYINETHLVAPGLNLKEMFERNGVAITQLIIAKKP